MHFSSYDRSGTEAEIAKLARSPAIRPGPLPKIKYILEPSGHALYYISDHRTCFELPSSCEFLPTCDGIPLAPLNKNLAANIKLRPRKRITSWPMIIPVVDLGFAIFAISALFVPLSAIAFAE